MKKSQVWHSCDNRFLCDGVPGIALGPEVVQYGPKKAPGRPLALEVIPGEGRPDQRQRHQPA